MADLRPLKVKVREQEGKITTAGRRALRASDFALPPGPEEKRAGQAGRYPIDTEERARNALARASRFLSGGELASVVRKVMSRYPNIEVNPDLIRKARRGG
jgi:hypothetical protein